MFELLSSLLKYIFITIIYVFIFGIIRLIYLDIKSMNNSNNTEDIPYLKLINRTDLLPFKAEENYVLDMDKIKIGRTKKCDIQIADPFLSSEHVQLLFQNGKYYIEDLNSTNGTFLNGNRITGKPAALKNGDMISIGQLDFLYVNNNES